MNTQTQEALKMAIEWFERKGYSNDRQPILEALQKALAQPQPKLFLDLSNSNGNHPVQQSQEPKCNNHPDAPHGFCRDASHSADRYVCECEEWEQPAQEPVTCDGKFPENFDASLGIPAQYLRLANGIMMDYMGKRSWDVPMCATAIMEFMNTHPAPSWQSLSDDEIWDIANFLGKNKKWDYPVMFAKTIEQALKEKNT